MMKIRELRELNIEELKKLLVEKKETVQKLRFDISAKQVKNHREIRNTKKEIAKIATLLREVK